MRLLGLVWYDDLDSGTQFDIVESVARITKEGTDEVAAGMGNGPAILPVVPINPRKFVAQCRKERGTYPVSQTAVKLYAAEYRKGTNFPPVVIDSDAKTLCGMLRGGFHRVAAAAVAGIGEIPAVDVAGARVVTILGELETYDFKKHRIRDPSLPGAGVKPLGRIDFPTEEEFLEYHRTGFIAPEAYAEYEEPGGLRWLGRGHNESRDPMAAYPILLFRRRYGSHEAEFRQSGEKLEYTKQDAEGWPVYGPDGRALMLSDEEIHTMGLPKTDLTIVAFIDGESIGFASDEWGAVGVWVERPYQGLGIGTDLLVEYLRRHPRFKGKLGQMTSAGMRLAKAVFRKMRGQ